jgi:hypothetical protein
MTTLASITRPDSWDFPLLLHVLGAMVLVGAAATGSILALTSDRASNPEWLRSLSFKSFLLAALPAYVVMRIGGEWLYEKEFGDVDSDPAWIGIGYITADAGALVLVITLVLSGFAVRKKPRLTKAAGILSLIAVVAWLVAVWAMGGKPG